MPVIGLDQYILDFYIIPSNDVKTLLVFDVSKYLNPPEKPQLYIWLPGSRNPIYINYNVNSLTYITSNTLGITSTPDPNCWQELPDGVYTIVLTFCPNEEFNIKKYYLNTGYLQKQFDNLILKSLDKENGCASNEVLQQYITEIDILIQGAKAEAIYSNKEKAMIKYQAARSKLESINRRLNCK